MSLPQLDEQTRRKPLTMDAATGRFITYDEIIDARGDIPTLDQLSPDQQRALIVERQRVGADYTMGDLNGRVLTREQIIEEIRHQTAFGNMVMQAEIDYLREFLGQIAAALRP